MRPLKGSCRGDGGGTLHWRRQYIRVCHCVCECVCALAGVKSAKSLWLQPPEFGNFLETDASKNYQRRREEEWDGSGGDSSTCQPELTIFVVARQKFYARPTPALASPFAHKKCIQRTCECPLKNMTCKWPRGGASRGKLAIALEAMRKLAS